MGRPRKRRFCRRYAADRVYKPQGIPLRGIDTIEVSLDQFEALRLCDLEGLDQQQAGEKMGVSRGTIQRLLYGARRSIVEGIMNNKAIIINLKRSEARDDDMHPNQRRRRTGRQRV